VSGPPEDGFAAANNFCAEAIGIEDGLNAIKNQRRKNRDSVFIEKDEASKLPLNKRDATLISFNGSMPAIIVKAPPSGDFV
jgi:hypothetical protein